jgi:hypothetical protein
LSYGTAFSIKFTAWNKLDYEKKYRRFFFEGVLLDKEQITKLIDKVSPKNGSLKNTKKI